jgi:hypothetical protein
LSCPKFGNRLTTEPIGSVTETVGSVTETVGSVTETVGFVTKTGGCVTETGGSVSETGGLVIETGGLVTETGGSVIEPGGSVTETIGWVTKRVGFVTVPVGIVTPTGGCVTETGGFVTEPGGFVPVTAGSDRHPPFVSPSARPPAGRAGDARSCDAPSQKVTATPRRANQTAHYWVRLPARRRGVAQTFCDGGVAATRGSVSTDWWRMARCAVRLPALSSPRRAGFPRFRKFRRPSAHLPSANSHLPDSY